MGLVEPQSERIWLRPDSRSGPALCRNPAQLERQRETIKVLQKGERPMLPRLSPSLAAVLLAASIAGTAPAAQAQGSSMVHPNSIQPETTLDVSAEATINAAPDIAYVNVGVTANGKAAAEAMASQAQAMNAMFAALAKAGIERKDMQTSGLSLYPEYDYLQINEEGGVVRNEQRLRGYVASNQLTVKVRKLDSLGATLDSLVAAGGNTVNGVSFALNDPKKVQDEARRKAMAEAKSRAELYADAAGMRVGRIVTISESVNYSGPAPVAYAERAMAADAAAPTPVAAGEVGYSANVSVKYELVK